MLYKSIIYKITNKINKKVYIGQSKFSLDRRLNDPFIGHFTKAFNTKKSNYLYNALRKYGKDNFDYEIIEEYAPRTYYRCISQEERDWLNEREKYWIAYYNSNNHELGYNQTSGGQNNYIRTPEERERLAYLGKLNMSRPGIREKISKKCKALWNNPEYLKNWELGVEKNKDSKKKWINKTSRRQHKIEKLNSYYTIEEALIRKKYKNKSLHVINKTRKLINSIPRNLVSYMHYYFIMKFGKDYRLKAFNITQKGKKKNIQRKLTPEQEMKRRRKISQNNPRRLDLTGEERILYKKEQSAKYREKHREECNRKRREKRRRENANKI